MANCPMYERDRKEVEMFKEVLNYFVERYPSSRLEMRGTIVRVNGKDVFNMDGWNLLFNLKRLCEALKDELL